MSGNPTYSRGFSGFTAGICWPEMVAGTTDGTIVRTDHQRKVPEVIGIENITLIVKQCTLTYISKHHTFVTCPIVTITELSSQTPVSLSFVPSENFRFLLFDFRNAPTYAFAYANPQLPNSKLKNTNLISGYSEQLFWSELTLKLGMIRWFVIHNHIPLNQFWNHYLKLILKILLFLTLSWIMRIIKNVSCIRVDPNSSWCFR